MVIYSFLAGVALTLLFLAILLPVFTGVSFSDMKKVIEHERRRLEMKAKRENGKKDTSR